MPKKAVTEAKKAIKSWLEDYCHKNISFKRNLFILYKQKKYKDIATAIKKNYLNGQSSAETTNFLQNGQHVLDIMKHLESFDFSSKNNSSKPSANKSSTSSTSTSEKRRLSEIEPTHNDSSKKDCKKSKKTVAVVNSDDEEFNEDEMTSFLDQADDDAMKRFYAVSKPTSGGPHSSCEYC